MRVEAPAGLVTLGLAMSGAAIAAHHSIAGVYDTGRQVSVEGAVAQFQFVNPHPFITLDVPDGSGRNQQWRLEMDNRHELVSVGMSADTLQPGDRVVVTGNPGREQANSLYIRTLHRPADGFRYEQVGSSPRIRVPVSLTLPTAPFSARRPSLPPDGGTSTESLG